jgi:hypothetical protein
VGDLAGGDAGAEVRGQQLVGIALGRGNDFDGMIRDWRVGSAIEHPVATVRGEFGLNGLKNTRAVPGERRWPTGARHDVAVRAVVRGRVVLRDRPNRDGKGGLGGVHDLKARVGQVLGPAAEHLSLRRELVEVQVASRNDEQ